MGKHYDLVTDLQFWNQSCTPSAFIDKILQQYAYHSILKEGHKKGFQSFSPVKLKDGSIRLVLQRWNS